MSNRDRMPRTMEEAFGPGGHNRAGLQAEGDKPPMDRADRIVITGGLCVVLALVLLMIFGIITP